MTQTINAPVGVGGVNRSSDTTTVQKLLNQMPLSQGGPNPKLKVDGICGPKTMTAISNFQKRQFGWADGLVEPKKQTIQRLNALAPRDKLDGMCGCQEVGTSYLFQTRTHSSFSLSFAISAGLAADVTTANPIAGSRAGVDAAKSKLPEARQWVQAAIQALDRIITFNGTRQDVAKLREFQAAKTHFHIDLSMKLSVLKRMLNLIPFIDFDDPVVQACKVARFTYFDLRRAMSDEVVNNAYVPYSEEDLDDPEIKNKAANVPEVRDGTIHFHPGFGEELGPLASVLTVIHETVHFLGSSYQEWAYRDRSGPESSDPRRYLDLPVEAALFNPDSYAYFALQMAKNIDRVIKKEE